ncbi:MAG: mechanosensitive ion channel family protein [Actinomycetota bacterium]|nr:mechanosensitive ion channel family protein [Actinomycetota bacterium]
MMNARDFFTSNQFVIPAAFIMGGLVFGLILEKLVLTAVRRIWFRKGWETYGTVKHGLRGMIVLWSVTVGLYSVTRFFDFRPDILDIYNKILLVLVAFSITLVAARISAGLVDSYLRRAEGAVPSTTIIGNIVRIVVVITGILVILIVLDIPITPIITALGIGGFAIALAFQDTLSNLFSGMYILASKQVTPGDYIKLDTGEEGHVVDVTWRNCTVKTLPNNLVVVPNAKLASAIITNYHRPVKEMSLLFEAGVAYDSDLEKVEEVTVDVAREVLKEVEGGVPHFEPFMRYHTFSDFSVDFTVILRVREYVDGYLVKHEFIKRLKRRYDEEGIVIPFPIRTVQLEREHQGTPRSS